MYAHQVGVPMVPLMLAGDYHPNGWLGMLLGAKLWYGFFGKAVAHEAAFQAKIDEMCRELGPPAQGVAALAPATSQIPARAPTPAPAPAPAMAAAHAPVSSGVGFAPNQQQPAPLAQLSEGFYLHLERERAAAAERADRAAERELRFSMTLAVCAAAVACAVILRK
jgi:hypothetical protein